MTRLFIRFYVGVLLILFGAGALVACSFRYFAPPEKDHFLEDVFGGGVQLARKLYLETGDSQASLASLQRYFAYPVEVLSLTDIPAKPRQRLAAGEDTIVYMDRDLFAATQLPSGARLLRLGPMPKFPGPSEQAMLASLVALLALVAAAIALLLRPVSRQLRTLEATAAAIAGGDFTARVDERRVTSVRMLARAMNDMAERTQTLLRTQREMLQAVSHELRTPLTRIGFAIDLLRTEQAEKQRAARLASIESAASELDNLVSELLHYVRWESSPPRVQDEDIELLSFIEDVIPKHASTQPGKRFSIGQNLKQREIATRADRLALERAVGNLIANAARFAKANIEVDCSVSADGVIIDVDDDGPGIPPADRERVFEPFMRLDESARGAGLGLTLVHRIISHYDGTITATDNPNGGCRMRIFLPAASTRRGQELYPQVQMGTV